MSEAQKDTITTVRNQIAQGNTREAIEELLSLPDNQWKDKVLILAARWRTLHYAEIENTLSSEEIQRERNRINKAVLAFIRQIDDLEEVPWYQRHFKTITVVFYLILGISLVFIGVQPKKHIPITMDISCDRFTFTYLSGGELFNDQPLRELNIQNFQQVKIQADSLLIDGYESRFETGPRFVLVPLDEIDGSSFTAYDLSLAELDFSSDATLVFELVKDLDNTLMIDIFHSEELSAIYYYQDSLSFLANYVTTNETLSSGKWDAIRGRFYSSSAQQLVVLGDTVFANFSFHFADSLRFDFQSLLLSAVDFSKRDQDIRVSSIIEAKAAFLGTNDKHFQTFSLQKGENLFLTIRDEYAVQRLAIYPHRLEMTIRGRATEVRTGPELQLRNPTLAQWLWFRHPHLLIGGSILLLGIMGLPFWLRSRRP